MNIQSMSLFSRKWSPESLHELFFPVLAVLAVVWVLYAWKRGDGVFGTAGLAAAVLTLFYLTSSYAPDSARWWAAGGIVLVGAVSLWRTRNLVWRPVFVSSGLLVALLAVLLTSSSVNLMYFEKFLAKVIAFHATGCIAWLVIRVVLPRTRGKQQAVQAAGLTVVLSLILLVISTTWWHEAAEAKSLPDSPVANTAREIREWFANPDHEHRNGIFAAGTMGDPALRSDGPGDPSEYLAHFPGGSRIAPGGGASDTLLPLQLEMRMADGGIVSVSGIRSAKQTSSWPDGGPHLWHRALRHGDPVVIWAEPGEMVPASDGRPVPSLRATRVIAHGTLESFRADFLNDLVQTARVFGWIALVCVLLSLIPLCFGIRHLFRNRGEGAATPSLTLENS